MQGQIEQAERLAYAAAETGQTAGQPDARLFFGLQLFGIRFEQGRHAELEETVAVMARVSLPLAQAIVAHIRNAQGRDAEARSLFDRLAARGFSDVPFENSWLTAIAVISQLCCDLGDTDRAVLLHPLLAPYEEQIVAHTLFWLGSVAHHLGALETTLERFDEADARFADAAAAHERLAAPIWLARTRLEWACMLLSRRRSGDTERARGLLGQTLAAARELGLGGVERRAVALLQGCP
jgi:hypothetical protein